MKTNATGGIILAGGASRRMGRDKALVCHNGKTMLERMVEALRPVTNRIIIVTASVDEYSVPGVETVPDLYPGAGPVGGILTGLTALGGGCHIVLACDMPLAQFAVLERLILAANENLQYDAVTPEIGGKLEPLCAVYNGSATPKLAAFMESGRRSAREALSVLNVMRIDEEELRRLDPELLTFTNINTPEELGRFVVRSSQTWD